MSESPKLTIYETFDVNWEDGFLIAIVVEVNPLQYWRDRPLLINTLDTLLTPAVNLNDKTLSDYVNDPKITNYIQTLKEIHGDWDNFEEVVAAILEEIEETSVIETQDPTTFVQESPKTFLDQIEIKNKNEEILESISFTEVKSMAEPHSNEAIIGLTPQEISELADEAVGEIIDLLEEVENENEEVVQEMEEFNNNVINDIPNSNYGSPDLDTSKNLSDPIKQWYGIPLIQLNKITDSLTDLIMLQLDTKNNWTINLTNIKQTSSEVSSRIDVTVPPGTKFLAGVSVSKHTQEISMFLKIDADEILYQNTITPGEPIKTEVTQIGSDSLDVKSLCGTLWDIIFWDKENPINLNLPNPFPKYPKNDYVFDFNDERVVGEYTYPSDNYKPPAYNGGNWFHLPYIGEYIEGGYYGKIKDFTMPDEPLDVVNDKKINLVDGTVPKKFIENGYFTKIFCRSVLLKADFTIMWWSYLGRYPTSTKTLISDDLHNNYIQYDYDNFELILSFNGKQLREKVSFPEDSWVQFTLRVNQETGEVYFIFIDTIHDHWEEFYLESGIDLEFELMTMFGRYDNLQKKYVEIFEAISGHIILSNNFKTVSEIQSIYLDTKPILKDYNPREIKRKVFYA